MGAAESSKKLRDNVQRVAENDRTYVEVNCENSSAGDRGAVALAEALRTNTRARILKLGGCDISHVGAQAIVDSLSNPLKKSRLRRLEFVRRNHTPFIALTRPRANVVVHCKRSASKGKSAR